MEFPGLGSAYDINDDLIVNVFKISISITYCLFEIAYENLVEQSSSISSLEVCLRSLGVCPAYKDCKILLLNSTLFLLLVCFHVKPNHAVWFFVVVVVNVSVL